MNTQFSFLLRKTAAFIIDTFLSSFLLQGILFLLYLGGRVTTAVPVPTIPSLQSSVATPMQLQTELALAFILCFALYAFFATLGMGRTVGMFAMNLIFVTPDTEGNPIKLSLSQMFLRTFICPFLTLLLFFIPGLPWPWDTYNRSLNDRISGTYIFAHDEKVLRSIIASIIVIVSCLFLLTIFLFA